APPACSTLPAGQPCVVHFTQFYGVIVGVILVGIVWLALRRQLAATRAIQEATGTGPATAKTPADGKATAKPPQPRASKRSGPVRRVIERHAVPNPGYVFWLFAFWYSILRSVLEEPFRDNPL